MKEFTIDAKGKSMGRVASEVSKLLQGKHLAEYAPNKLSGVTVHVTNLSQVRFTGRKLADKVYYKHTGYIGHVKETKLKDIFVKDPRLAFEKILSGMLPKNKLRSKWLRYVKMSA